MIEHADSDSKESESNMINPQILLQKSTMNKHQESINESVNELAIDELMSELTRISTRSNKEIFTSTKFKDKNFDKKSRQIHMTKLIRNINFDDKNKSTMMQEVINHLI